MQLAWMARGFELRGEGSPKLQYARQKGKGSNCWLRARDFIKPASAGAEPGLIDRNIRFGVIINAPCGGAARRDGPKQPPDLVGQRRPGIDSISVSPDSYLTVKRHVAAAESRTKPKRLRTCP
jgi:hypothetical protein